MPILRKIISGGQRGVDIAALNFAKQHGLETGGYMPAGFRTQEGLRPEYAELYGMVETVNHSGYSERTFRNVCESDGTLRLALRWDTPGELCTLKAIRKYRKPHCDVQLRIWDPRYDPLLPATVAKWIIGNKIEVLNVAGNATAGLELAVKGFLAQVWGRLLALEALDKDV